MLFLCNLWLIITQRKLVTHFILITVITSMLFSCVTTYHGDGVVIEKRKYYTQNHFKKGLIVTVGSILLGAGVDAIPNVAISCLFLGAASALTFGAAGIVVGAGTSYFLYRSKNMQQFKVKSLETGKIFIIEQYSSIPVNAKVKIIERNKRVFIKKQSKS
jgi:hypothetical protein